MLLRFKHFRYSSNLLVPGKELEKIEATHINFPSNMNIREPVLEYYRTRIELLRGLWK
jgi:hypothetical protein